MIRCTLCEATSSTAARAPQDDGWTQAAITGPKGNRYLSACAAHAPADIAAWLKAAIAAVRGKA